MRNRIFTFVIIFNIIGICISILIKLEKFNISNTEQEYVINQSSIILRIVNFIFTSQIIYMISFVYGIIIWILYDKNIDFYNFIKIYDGGNTLFSTLSGIFVKDLYGFLLITITSILFILTYFIDIYYVKALYYTNTLSCIESNNVSLGIISKNSYDKYDLDFVQKVYVFGSSVAITPFRNNTGNNNYYKVPITNPSNELTEYYSIIYNISTVCKNAKINITKDSYGFDIINVYDNFNNTIISSLSSKNDIAIDVGNIKTRNVDYFIGFSINNISTNNLNKFTFYNRTTTMVLCNTKIDPYVENNKTDWININDTASYDIAHYASRIIYDISLAYSVITNSKFHTPWLSWITGLNDINTKGISLENYENNMKWIHRAYLEGGNVNNEITKVKGKYCKIDLWKSNIDNWYFIIFIIIQIIFTIFICLLYFIKKEYISNSSENLIKIINYNNKNNDLINEKIKN